MKKYIRITKNNVFFRYLYGFKPDLFEFVFVISRIIILFRNFQNIWRGKIMFITCYSSVIQGRVIILLLLYIFRTSNREYCYILLFYFLANVGSRSTRHCKAFTTTLYNDILVHYSVWNNPLFRIKDLSFN